MNLLFNAELTKAEEVDGKLFLAGVASDTSIDKQSDRMDHCALDEMVKTAVGIPLTNSHANELENQIGTIVEAKVDGSMFAIKAELDSDDPAAVRLFKKIAKGGKAGFSVGGKITSARPSLEKGCQRIITGVALDHVMLTAKPANGNTFAQALCKTFEDLDAQDRKDDTPLTGVIMDTELEKGGARFSDETKAALASIHANGNDDTKAKVRGLLGSNADSILGAADNLADDTNANNDDHDDDGDRPPIGIIGKSEDKPTISADDIKAIVAAELAKALAEQVAKPKGSADMKSAPTDLSKCTPAQMWALYAEELQK